MRCTYCHSTNVVWDYERGCVVCGDCGTVIDVIYQFHTPFNQRGNHEFRSSKKVRQNPSLNKHTRMYLKLVRKASEHGLVVDNDVFKRYSSGHSQLVKVFKKPNVDLNRLTSGEHVKLVLDVMRKYPRLVSRTDRAKVALAKIALSMLSEDGLDVRKLSSELSISEVHLRRLQKIVLEEFEFLDDVRTSLLNNAKEVHRLTPSPLRSEASSCNT